MHFIQELPLGHLIVILIFLGFCIYLFFDYFKKDKGNNEDNEESNIVEVIKAIDGSDIVSETSKCQLIEIAIRCLSERNDGVEDGTDSSDD